MNETQKEVVHRAIEAIKDLDRFKVHVTIRLSVDLSRALEGLNEMQEDSDEQA